MRSAVHRGAKSLWAASFEIGKRWWNHNHSHASAALAFYSLFSMVPILVVVTSVASAVIGTERAEEGIDQAVKALFDENSGHYLRELLRARPDERFTGISSIIGFCVLLFTASRVVVELREALMVAFGKRANKGRHGFIVDLVIDQGIPILLVLALGIVLVISAIAGAALQLVAMQLDAFLPRDLILWSWAQKIIPLVIETLLFAAILRWLPPKPPGFRESLTGALVTCVLLLMLRGLIAFYFGQSSVTTAYGAAVTLVVVLLWIYFTIQIFFIGAEAAAYLERKRQPELDLEPK